MTILFINASDVEALEEVSYKTACKRIQEVIKRYGLPKSRDISLKAYCDCYHLREKHVSRRVEAHRAQIKKSA